MAEDAQPEVVTQQLFTFDAEKFSQLFDNLRSSTTAYIDFVSGSFDKASDLNKQISAFHERLLLIDLGTIGLSVTALTSVASKVAMIGWRKYLLTALVVLAWGGLLMSTFLCRAVMNDLLAANRKLYDEWLITAFEFNSANIANDIQRLSLTMKGPLTVENQQVDSTTIFNNLASEMRAKFSEAKRAHLEKTLKTAGATDVMPTGAASRHAIKYMQTALMLLALAAILLVVSL